MKSGRRLIFQISVILFLIAGGALTRHLLYDPYVSSPTAARPWADDEWNESMIPVVPPSPGASYAPLEMSEVTIKEDTESLMFEYPIRNYPYGRLHYDIIHADENQTVTLPGGHGALRLALLGGGYRTKPGNEEWPPLQYVDPATGDPLSPEGARSRIGMAPADIERIWSEHHYKLSLFLDTGEIEDFVCDQYAGGIRLFDGDTHFQIGSIHYHGTIGVAKEGPIQWTGAFLPVGYQRTIVFVCDFEYGPTEVREFPLTPGEKATFSDFEVRLLTSFAGKYSKVGSGLLNAAGPGRDILGIGWDTSDGEIISAALSFAPRHFGGVCAIDFIGDDGTVVPYDRRRGGNTDIWFAGSDLPASETVAIRITHRPHRARAVFTLPALPGLLPENEDLDNLFDARVTRYVVESPGHFISMIAECAQIHAQRFDSDIRFPAGYFPREFEDQTLRSLVKEFASHSPRFRINRNTHVIAEVEPIDWGEEWKIWKRKAKSLLP